MDGVEEEALLKKLVDEGQLHALLERCLTVAISKDDYCQWWEPWKRALIIKVLGCSISFRILEG